VKFRSALICCAALAFGFSIQNEASAARRVRFTPLPTPTTILPSRAELSAVPVPQQGRLLAYPANVVRYGLTVHPGSRIVRGLMAR